MPLELTDYELQNAAMACRALAHQVSSGQGDGES